MRKFVILLLAIALALYALPALAAPPDIGSATVQTLVAPISVGDLVTIPVIAQATTIEKSTMVLTAIGADKVIMAQTATGKSEANMTIAIDTKTSSIAMIPTTYEGTTGQMTAKTTGGGLSAPEMVAGFAAETCKVKVARAAEISTQKSA